MNKKKQRQSFNYIFLKLLEISDILNKSGFQFPYRLCCGGADFNSCTRHCFGFMKIRIRIGFKIQILIKEGIMTQNILYT
jgi:hypothetical protein